MSPHDNYERAMELFDRVCDLPATQRASVLKEVRGDDAALRAQVEALLEADASQDARLGDDDLTRHRQQLAAGLAEVFAEDAAIPERIAEYRIVRKIGEGGMGVIYEAEQESPRRRVALKVLRAGMIGREMLKRFQQEAHVLGQLQHPGIAHIHEAGFARMPRGRLPFFVMEYVDGESLDRYAASHGLGVPERMELLARVCDAVQHAHQKGIIHRDLKPTNILVVNDQDSDGVTKRRSDEVGRRSDEEGGLDDGVSGLSHAVRGLSDRVTKRRRHEVRELSGGGGWRRNTSFGSSLRHSVASLPPSVQPKVLDFGIARVTDADIQSVTVQTEVGQIVGTLAYMSPEQVAGRSDELDTRCDVYALGVMLYELLIGRRPHDLTGLPVVEASRIVREREPARLGALDRSLRGDVETIVAKSMEKDRERRYSSAAEMAADIRRFLSDQPIDARPASAFYQLGKFARRNRGLVTGVTAAFVMLVAALIGTGYGLVQAAAQRDQANMARDAAQKANEQLRTVVDYQSAMLEELDVEGMGRQIFNDLRSEARASLDGGGDALAGQLASFEQVLSRINATTIANRALDASIMSRAVAALDTTFSDEPSLQADLRSSLAGIYDHIGLAEKSLAQARLERETLGRVAGDEAPQTLSAQQRVCELLMKVGSYEEAEQSARDLLGTQRRVLGEDHVDTLNTQRILGQSLVKLTRPDEALDVLRDALSRLERSVGPTHAATLMARNELGNHCLQQRDYESAREAYEFVLRAFEAEFGPQDEKTLAVLGQVAQTHFLKKEYEPAASYLERIASAQAASKGDDHVDTLTTRLQLANCLTELGRYEEAEPLVLDTLDRSRRVLGSDHPTTVVALSATLRLMLKLRRWDKAEEYGIEALAVAERTLGPDNIRTLDARSDVTIFYLKSDNPEAAIRLGMEALREYQRVLGRDHRRTMTMEQLLAKALMSAGDVEAAASHLEEIVRICREKYAPHSVFAGSLGLSVTVLIALDRGAEAEPLARELLAWCESHNVGNATLGRCYLWIARTQLAQARLDDADESLAKAIDHMTGNMAEDQPDLLLARLLAHVVAVRRGEADCAADALSTYRNLLASGGRMLPEDRNTILPEARRLLQAAEIDVDEAAK